ncbi:MAG: cache domain-containing protein [Oligoflexia bacterium]|nr:cache domain-containing protein [Oligoflexia bacterium]
MLVRIITIFAVFSLFSTMAFAEAKKENCTDANKYAVCKEDVVKQHVIHWCDRVKKEGDKAFPEMKKFRFNCCGDEQDYVWVNDTRPYMIMHPIKPQLEGKDLMNFKDPGGKFLFQEFIASVKKSPDGGWVDYQWTKFGESDPTPKKSWVMMCKSPKGEEFIVGSGTWAN